MATAPEEVGNPPAAPNAPIAPVESTAIPQVPGTPEVPMGGEVVTSFPPGPQLENILDRLDNIADKPAERQEARVDSTAAKEVGEEAIEVQEPPVVEGPEAKSDAETKIMEPSNERLATSAELSAAGVGTVGSPGVSRHTQHRLSDVSAAAEKAARRLEIPVRRTASAAQTVRVAAGRVAGAAKQAHRRLSDGSPTPANSRFGTESLREKEAEITAAEWAKRDQDPNKVDVEGLTGEKGRVIGFSQSGEPIMELASGKFAIGDTEVKARSPIGANTALEELRRGKVIIEPTLEETKIYSPNARAEGSSGEGGVSAGSTAESTMREHSPAESGGGGGGTTSGESRPTNESFDEWRQKAIAEHQSWTAALKTFKDTGNIPLMANPDKLPPEEWKKTAGKELKWWIDVLEAAKATGEIPPGVTWPWNEVPEPPAEEPPEAPTPPAEPTPPPVEPTPLPREGDGGDGGDDGGEAARAEAARRRDFETARNDLVRFTILRRGHAFDAMGLLHGRDREAYNAAYDAYMTQKAAVLRAEREAMLGRGMTEREVEDALEAREFELQREFARTVHSQNETEAKAAESAGGLRGMRAHLLRRWAGYSRKKRFIIGLAVGVGAGVASAGLGLGLAGIVLGASAKASIGVLNRSATAVNRSEHARDAELGRIDAEQARSRHRRIQSRLNLRHEFNSDEYLTEQEHRDRGRNNYYERERRRSRRRNRIGWGIIALSLLPAAEGVSLMAGINPLEHVPYTGWVPKVPNLWKEGHRAWDSLFGGASGVHHNVAPGVGPEHLGLHYESLSVNHGNWYDSIWHHIQEHSQPNDPNLRMHVQSVLNMNRQSILNDAATHGYHGTDLWQAARHLSQGFKFRVPNQY